LRWEKAEEKAQKKTERRGGVKGDAPGFILVQFAPLCKTLVTVTEMQDDRSHAAAVRLDATM
jgi:hypothetical protein